MIPNEDKFLNNFRLVNVGVAKFGTNIKDIAGNVSAKYQKNRL